MSTYLVNIHHIYFCVTLDFQVFKLVMNAIAQWDGTTRAAFLNLWEKHKQQRSSVWENLCYFLFKKKNWSKNEGRQRRSDMHGQATDFGTFSPIQSKLQENRCSLNSRNSHLTQSGKELSKKEILGGIGLQFLVVPTAVHKGVRRSAKIYI